MKTLICKISDPGSCSREIVQAAEILRGGGLVAIPTETVYGLGANALDEKAVRRIFEVKGRPADNPLIAHISSLDMWAPLVREVTPQARTLAERFWPGPLSIILPQSGIVPSVTRGGLDTIAVRMPANDTALAVIAAAGVPVAAPSANLSGRPSPTSAKHCIDDLNGKIEAIIDAGSCGVGVESTVITLAGDVPTVLRPGAVTLEQLREVLGEVRLHESANGVLPEDEAPASPGMKYRHYSPKAELILIEADGAAFARYVNERCSKGVYALCFDEDAKLLACPSLTYGGRGDHALQARLLFSRLREFDGLGAGVIYARSPERAGIGEAVYNRLLRAAGGKIITL